MVFTADDERWMREAIAVTRAGIAAGQTPFGCAIVRASGLVAASHNQVWAAGDPTAHAEVTAIRAATAKLGAIALTGCTLYSTCEPCPMCMAAIHWARLERVVYGAAIADAAAAGFHELHLPAAELARLGGSPVAIEAGCLAPECRALFAAWQAHGAARTY
ncbi:MAG: nucleoside deaminase [Acidobacteria bacterium]|nr:MAG: nucleoside deaminase [Acidobacteriota bacterium]